MGQPKEYNQPRSTVAKMYSDLPRRRNVSNDGDKELSYEVVDLTKVDQDVFTIDRSICEAMADYRLSAYIGLLKIVTKPLPSSRITSGKYLFRNESLNLRSLWTSFILSTAQSHTYQADYSAEDAEKQSIQRHFGNKLDNTLCRLRHWMEVWAGKRRAHQYRKKNEKRKPSSRSSHKSNEDRPIRSCSSGTRVSKRARADEEWQPTDEDSSSSDEGTSNLFVLYGVSGSGKTQLVHQLASEIGYRVIEINSAQVRSAATVKKILTEASLSHGIVLQTPSAPTIDVVDLATSPESKKTNRNKSIQEKSNTSSRHSLEKVDSLDSSAKGRKSDLSRDLNLILVDEVRASSLIL